MGYFDDTRFHAVYDMIEAVNTVVERNISELMETVRADQLGLDIRAGYELFVNEDCIAVRSHNRRTLDYYGGFEYVDSEYVQTMGDYTFYFADDERVQECIDAFYATEEDEGLLHEEDA